MAQLSRNEAFPHTHFCTGDQTEDQPMEQTPSLVESSEEHAGCEEVMGAEMSRESVGCLTEDQNCLEGLIGFEGIAEALLSVATSQSWGLGGMKQRYVPRFLVPAQNEAVVTPLKHIENADDDKVTDEAKKAEGEDHTSKGLFESKYLDAFPLYQHYCLQTLKTDLNRINKSLSELVTAQCLPGLQSPLIPHFASTVVNKPLSHARVDSCSSWRDLPEVKESGLLCTLPIRVIRLQEAMFEMITSEASYLKRLRIAVNHFFASEALKLTVHRVEHHILFSNLCSVREADKTFLLDLEACLGENAMVSHVGDVVLRHSPRLRSVYVPYVTNMMYQESLITMLMQENREFLLALKKLESDPICQRQTLKSFLVLPFQRITRLKIILENVLKLTEQGSESVPFLKEAIEVTHKMVMECNEGVQQMKQMEELVYLDKLIDFSHVKSIPLVTSGRFLMHDGPLRLLKPEGYVPGSRISYKDIYLHIFNDLLLISLKKDQGFSVLDHAVFPTHVHTEQLKTEALGLPHEAFVLRLSQNHTGHATAFILAPHTVIRSKDKEAWMKALSTHKVSGNTRDLYVV
ncbi:hypothetical protein UPYG_G00174390 [Umbra pygmaea]|uniref:DH domain-containing protein n=1 Tax=Umbra pygmaea TaxID=75934 RepID=A0ABD0WPF5_UMBPY